MSTQTNALSLHEILLSISDSLNKAQNQLRNVPPFDEYGRPNTIYHLPHLDFNLEVISEFSTESSDTSATKTISSRASTQLAQVPAINYIRFVSFDGMDLSKSSKNKITSTISGRFVAVLPNDGLQQVFISCSTKQQEVPNRSAITVKLQYATGDPVTGQRVEVNFDKETSLGINEIELTSDPVFIGNKDGFTDSNGEFVTTVEADKTDFYAGRTFIFVANSGTLFTSIAISNS